MIKVNKVNENEKIDWVGILYFFNGYNHLDTVLNNVKSISIQLKDINMMEFSSNPVLKAFGTIYRIDDYENLEEYIEIPNKHETSKLIYNILSSDWFIIEERLDQNLEAECEALQDKIDNYNRTRKTFKPEEEHEYTLMLYRLKELKRLIQIRQRENNPTLNLSKKKN